MGTNRIDIEIGATDNTKGATKKAIKEIKNLKKTVDDMQKSNTTLSKALELVNRKLLRSTREARLSRQKYLSLASIIRRLSENTDDLNRRVTRQGEINKKLVRTLRDANRRLRENRTETDRNKKSVNSLNSSLTVLKKSLKLGLGVAGIGSFVGGLYALQKAMRSVTNDYREFDDAVRNAAAVLDRSEKSFERLAAVARKSGAETRFTAIQAAEGLEQLGRATGDIETSIAALPKVLNLASAGNVGVAEAVKIATGAMAAYNLEVKDMGQVIDVLSHIDSTTKATVYGLGESLTYVGGTARSAGVEFEDLYIALGLAAKGNLDASIAGTSLNQMLSMLLRPSGESIKLMKKLQDRMGGVALQFKKANGAFIGFVPLMKQFKAAGIDAGEVLRILNIRGGRFMNTLMIQGVDAFEAAQKKMKEVAGTASEVSGFKESGIGGVLRKLISVFQELKIAIGETFNNDIIDGMDSIRLKLLDIIINWKEFSKTDDFLKWKKETVEGLYAIADAAKAVVSIVKTLSFVWSGHRNKLLEQLDIKKKIREADERGVDFIGKISKAETRMANMKQKIWLEEQARIKKAKEDKEGQEAIGIAGFKRPEKPNLVAAEALRIAKLKEKIAIEMDSLRRMMADVSITEFISEEAYDAGKISIEEYFKGRKKALQDRFNKEKGILTASIGLEKDIEKQKIIETEIYELEKKHILNLMELDAERESERTKTVKKKKTENIAEIKAKETFRRSVMAAQTAELEREQNYEAGRLSVEDYLRGKEDAIRERTANQNTSLNTSLEGAESEGEELRIKTELFNVEQQQIRDLMSLEQEAADLKKRLIEEDREAKIKSFNMTRENFANTAQVMADMYELGGKKMKAFFYLSKAASLAEATMNIAEGITGAMKSGIPVVSQIQAGIVAAMGAVQVGKILSTNLADGGIVPGSSPHSKADDKTFSVAGGGTANLTSGEFVHQISSVRYYGKNVMSALNNKLIPREIFTGIPQAPSPSSGFALAGGGMISNAKQDGEMREKDEINIVNITDSRQIDQYLSSSAGQNAIINVLSNKAQTVKRILR